MLFAHLHSHGVRRDHAQCRCKPKWGPRTTIGELPKLCVKMRPDSWLVCGPFRCHRLPYWLSIFWRPFYSSPYRTKTVIHLHAPRKFSTYVTRGSWAYLSPLPTGRYGGLSTGSVNTEPVCRLCQLIINEINSHVRPGPLKQTCLVATISVLLVELKRLSEPRDASVSVYDKNDIHCWRA